MAAGIVASFSPGAGTGAVFPKSALASRVRVERWPLRLASHLANAATFENHCERSASSLLLTCPAAALGHLPSSPSTSIESPERFELSSLALFCSGGRTLAKLHQASPTEPRTPTATMTRKITSRGLPRRMRTGAGGGGGLCWAVVGGVGVIA